MKSVVTGAVLGFLAVVAGAATGHGPVAGLDSQGMRPILTALRYQELGAVMIVITGLASVLVVSKAAGFRLAVSSWLFVAGTLLFSFSIYARIILDFEWLGPVTPIGGLCHMAGWIALGWAALAVPSRDG
ncbi:MULTISPECIES: DUF423 domain-containing protein [unclassified Wenzhouxiangella]|uniref:DUF423 domain-containing protein n=1 Tax=unclassified Wenzhouxiangella TaxID=2613841 RepID=UPI0015F26963|nr:MULTISPECIES: DUF423 domain-containing protein [unclassified Wenzhouxiangella]